MIANVIGLFNGNSHLTTDEIKSKLLSKKAKWVIYSTVLPWALITFIIYVMIMFGGFVEMWGVDHSFTLKHYIEAFSVDWVKERGLLWTGTAWNSFNTTFTIAIISALPTAAIGILTAYLLTRHKFRGKNAFTFVNLLFVLNTSPI